MKYKICCLIPVKKNSKRLKNKNFLKLDNKTIFEKTLEKALNSKIFDEIIVSSDNAEIIKKSKYKFTFLKRPKYLSKDPSTITDVMIHACKHLDLLEKRFNTMAVLSVTNPFFDVQDITKSIKSFKKNNSEGLLSISEFSAPPYNAWIKKKNHLEPAFKNSNYKFTKSTECPKTYFSNGALRLVNLEKFLKKKNFHKLKLTYYETKDHKSIDIDTKYEYTVAKLIQKHGAKKFS